MKLDLKAPHTVYKATDGRRLTGVTTYLGVLDKPALRGWYAAEERAGVLAAKGADLPVKNDGKPLWFAEAKRDKAADLGTVTHARCEAWLLNDELEPAGIPKELFEKSLIGLKRFQAWWLAEGFHCLHSERVVIYDDGKMAYGGTADIVARDPAGRIVLVDLKTSKASPYWPYPEVYGQVAAYAEGLANDPTTALDVDRIVVARIGKEEGDTLQTAQLTSAQRAAGWKLFCAAFDATEAKKALEKLSK